MRESQYFHPLNWTRNNSCHLSISIIIVIKSAHPASITPYHERNITHELACSTVNHPVPNPGTLPYTHWKSNYYFPAVVNLIPIGNYSLFLYIRPSTHSESHSRQPPTIRTVRCLGLSVLLNPVSLPTAITLTIGINPVSQSVIPSASESSHILTANKYFFYCNLEEGPGSGTRSPSES